MIQQIFDELYEKIKKVLLPTNKKSAEIQSSSPATPVKTEESVVKTTSPENTTGKVVLPPIKLQKEENINLARGTLTLEQQRELLEERRKVPPLVLFLKYTSLILTIVGVVSFLWIKVDLDETNGYLKFFGIRENTGLKFKNLVQKKSRLESELSSYTTKNQKFQRQIEEKNYSVYTTIIDSIKKEQLVWFDRKKNDGTIIYGLLDSPLHMQDYFNSSAYDDPILSGTGNNVVVKNITANRQGVTFSIEASQLFGKVFSLNTEFVKMMNSFPLFKGGKLEQFSKKKDSEGNDSMGFSLKLSLQSPSEIDTDDQYFSKYDQWLQKNNSLSSIK